MAIAFDAASSAVAVSSASSQSWSHTIGGGSNRILVVGFSTFLAGDAVTWSVTYNGVALTQFAMTGSDTDTWVIRKGFYVLKEASMPAAGTYTVTISAPLAVSDLSGGATSWTDADQTTPLHNFNTSNASDASPTLAVSSATGEVALDVMSYKFADGFTFNQTQRWNRIDTSGVLRGTAGQSAAGASPTVTMSYTVNQSVAWEMCGASLMPSSGTDGTVTLPGALLATGAMPIPDVLIPGRITAFRIFS
jgi:hypothetical protein